MPISISEITTGFMQWMFPGSQQYNLAPYVETELRNAYQNQQDGLKDDHWLKVAKRLVNNSAAPATSPENDVRDREQKRLQEQMLVWMLKYFYHHPSKCGATATTLNPSGSATVSP